MLILLIALSACVSKQELAERALDDDADGFLDAAAAELHIDGPYDCDDTDPATNPDAAEVCGGADEDCDGLVDDEDQVADPPTWYLDVDGDGYGGSTTQSACVVTGSFPGFAEQLDCDDADAATNPDAAEICGGGDEDCDGGADDADPQGATDATAFYADADADGFGNELVAIQACVSTVGYPASVAGYCDDTEEFVYPGAPELCDEQQNDCETSWTMSAETGKVTWFAADGSADDVSASWAGAEGAPAEVQLPDDGVAAVCPGTYLVSLASGSNSTVECRAGAILSGDDVRPVLSVGSQARASVSGCALTRGYDGSFGGLVKVSGTLSLTDSTLSNSHSLAVDFVFSDGGSVIMSDVEIDASTVDADADSPIIYFYGGSAELSDVSFVGPRGIGASASTVSMTDVDMTSHDSLLGTSMFNCRASDCDLVRVRIHDHRLSAIEAADGAIVDLVDSEIDSGGDSNTASPAILVSDASVVLRDSNISNWSGTAIAATNGATADLIHSSIRDCVSDYASAVELHSSAFTADNTSTIADNLNTGSGNAAGVIAIDPTSTVGLSGTDLISFGPNAPADIGCMDFPFDTWTYASASTVASCSNCECSP